MPARDRRGSARMHLLARTAAIVLLALMTIVLLGAGDWAWADPLAVLPGTMWFVLAVLVITLSAAAEDWIAGLLALVAAIWSLTWVGIVNGEPARVSDEPRVRVLSWNINLLPDDPQQLADVLRAVHSYDPDLAILQEARLDAAEVQIARDVFGPDFEVLNRGEFTIVSRYPLGEPTVPPSESYLKVQADVNGVPIDVYNVHWYSFTRDFELRRTQYRALVDDVRDQPRVIVAGDLNLPAHHPWQQNLARLLNISNPTGWSLPVTLPSVFPVARVDYVMSSDDFLFGDYTQFTYEPSVRGHDGIVTDLYLPSP